MGTTNARSRRDRGGEADFAPNAPDAPKRDWKESLANEVRTHRFGYAVLAVALVTSPLLILKIFPGVSPIQAVIGGLAFGVYLALCAVPQKFM